MDEPLLLASRSSYSRRFGGIRNHTQAKFYTYDAPHGFFAYGRSTYDDAAARKSWKRAVEFFHEHLR